MTALKIKPSLALALAATVVPIPQKAWGQTPLFEEELDDADGITHAERSPKEIESDRAIPAQPSAPTNSAEPEFSVVEPAEQAEPPAIRSPVESKNEVRESRYRTARDLTPLDADRSESIAATPVPVDSQQRHDARAAKPSAPTRSEQPEFIFSESGEEPVEMRSQPTAEQIDPNPSNPEPLLSEESAGSRFLDRGSSLEARDRNVILPADTLPLLAQREEKPETEAEEKEKSSPQTKPSLRVPQRDRVPTLEDTPDTPNETQTTPESNAAQLAQESGTPRSAQILEPATIVPRAIQQPTAQPNSSNYPALTLPEATAPETEVTQQPDATQTPDNAEYKLPPRIVPSDRVTPVITSLSVNNVPISHLTEWEATAADTFGNHINNQFSFNGTLKLNSQVSESLSRDNVYTIDQTGHYLQLQTARQSREVTTSVTQPQTLLGFQIQMSLTAPCRFPNTDPSQTCTYTPGLITDKESIDPDTLLPTRVLQPSKLGDTVTPESLTAMQQPGFQMGANGQQVGIDLYFPNAGAVEQEGEAANPSITREENIDNTPVPIYARVRQIVRANDREAVIGRTVRGIPFVVGDKNQLLNASLQISNVLPDAVPSLEGSENPANTNVNRNLFLAANNARLPDNSFTVYQAGLGRAETPDANLTDIRQLPAANYNSVWLGISPITERDFSTSDRFEITSPTRVIAEGGGEGGVNSNVSLLSAVNGVNFSTDNLQNFYTQVYLKFFNTDVNRISGSRLREDTSYYPHLSFTGNITRTEDVFRYYAGAIAAPEVKAYIGADYTKNTLNGWTFSAGGIGYLNPDRDYYSQLRGGIAKNIPLGDNSNLVLSSNVNYAIDRETSIGETLIVDPASSLSVGARANLGPVSLGTTYFVGGVLPNSLNNTLVTDLGVNIGDRFRIAGYYTPINESSSRSRYGANASLKLGDGYNSPTLTFGWANQQYNFGSGTSQNDNIFTVLLRLGSPRNPFTPSALEQLNR